MTLTVDLLRQWFVKFNTAYFADTLPVPALALSKARTRLGTMSCQCRHTVFGRRYSGFTIRVSTWYDCTEREYQTVLLHEMIHYYITYNGIRDTSAHGREFRRIMHWLNTEHGWNITISSKLRGMTPGGPQQRQEAMLVLAMVMRNGERYLSVVNPRHALHIDRTAQSVAEIVQHRWYMTHDTYFSTFPKVRSLRARRVTEEVYDEKTRSMTPLALKQT